MKVNGYQQLFGYTTDKWEQYSFIKSSSNEKYKWFAGLKKV